MIILLCLAALILAGFAIRHGAGCCSTREMIGEVSVFVGCILLVISTAAIPVGYQAQKGEIVEFLSVRQSVESARSGGVDIENAAIQHKIIESNRWLASKKYYNDTCWGLWITDDVNELEPIE